MAIIVKGNLRRAFAADDEFAFSCENDYLLTEYLLHRRHLHDKKLLKLFL